MDTPTHAMQLSLGLLSVMAALGFCCTFLIPEPNGLSLEEIVTNYFDYEEGEDNLEDKDLQDENGAISYPVFEDEFSGYTAPAQCLTETRIKKTFRKKWNQIKVLPFIHQWILVFLALLPTQPQQELGRPILTGSFIINVNISDVLEHVRSPCVLPASSLP